MTDWLVAIAAVLGLILSVVSLLWQYLAPRQRMRRHRREDARALARRVAAALDDPIPQDAVGLADEFVDLRDRSADKALRVHCATVGRQLRELDVLRRNLVLLRMTEGRDPAVAGSRAIRGPANPHEQKVLDRWYEARHSVYDAVARLTVYLNEKEKRGG